MQIYAVDSSGCASLPCILSMDAHWNVSLRSSHSSDKLLSLSCVFPWGQDVIYLFSAIPSSDLREPVENLPAPVAELLLFPPLVPLKWQQGGFQALASHEWDAIVATQLADRPPTCASVPIPVAPAPHCDVNSLSSDDCGAESCDDDGSECCCSGDEDDAQPEEEPHSSSSDYDDEAALDDGACSSGGEDEVGA